MVYDDYVEYHSQFGAMCLKKNELIDAVNDFLAYCEGENYLSVKEVKSLNYGKRVIDNIICRLRNKFHLVEPN